MTTIGGAGLYGDCFNARRAVRKYVRERRKRNSKTKRHTIAYFLSANLVVSALARGDFDVGIFSTERAGREIGKVISRDDCSISIMELRNPGYLRARVTRFIVAKRRTR